ncbi:hypothetical protein ACQ259_02935 [Stutzerimonas stutzeri]|uniref:hypothetical protein n=1 Tax=Stutzerimonas stutzeri TaxID=316 RepID=UPI003D322EA1
MANFIAVNPASNLITGVISSHYTPVDTKTTRFFRATDDDLSVYYRLHKKLSAGDCVDFADLLTARKTYRAKRKIIAPDPIGFDRLPAEHLQTFKEDALRMVQQGKSLSFVCYALRCSEREALKLTGLQPEDFGEDSEALSPEIQHMLKKRQEKKQAQKEHNA